MQPIITGLDHLLIHCRDMSAQVPDYEHLLGSSARWIDDHSGARTAIITTANVHVVLKESSECEGLVGLGLQTTDLNRVERRLQRLGVAVEADAQVDPVALAQGHANPGPMRFLAEDGSRGLRIGVVARSESPPVGSQGDASSTLPTGLDHAVIASADATRTAFLLGSQLGLDLRMDLTRPDWGARLLFFRCGDSIIEVFEKVANGDNEAKSEAANTDAFYGLSWRVSDAAAVNAELKDRGFDVSALRDGRKPGTRVFTVRDKTAGVPTLVLDHVLDTSLDPLLDPLLDKGPS